VSVQLEQAIDTGGVASGHIPIRRIQPQRGLFRIDLPELWRFRELFFFLIWRDIKARYRQTILGGFWAIFRPFMQMIVFTLLLGGGIAKVETGTSLPYALFVFPGLLMWTYFSSGVSGGAAAITGNAGLVTKAYFPRIHLVLAAILAPVIDFMLALVVVVGLFAYYQMVPPWQIVLLPAFLGLAVVLVAGLGLWLSPLTVRYRDVPYALPFLLQIWMYVTPVLYPTSLIPAQYQWLIALNPFSGIALGARWAMVGGEPPSAVFLATSIGISAGLVLTGILYFRRREPSFPDFI